MWQKIPDECVLLDEKANSSTTCCDSIDNNDLHELTYGDDHDRSEDALERHLELEEDTDEDDEFKILPTRNFRSYCHFRYCYVCVYIVLSVILLTAVIAFAIVLILILIPYVRTVGFRNATCSAISASETTNESACACGKGCDASVPCLVIRVTYSDEMLVSHNASLFENELLLGKMCSFYLPCRSAHLDNLYKVQAYRARYGSHTSPYPCLYNPHNTSQVIRTHRFQIHHVIHGMVWSSAVLLTSCILLALAIRRKGCSS